ncbi:hypothetical protein CHS0354_043047 [Potamilus streckersoni]|uniref:Uncharacterized protein n=1 Tax=Potamilus streckersoni TaxID=2493646 RepID=A0AAE0VT25_9BIVA|nr:hypothetical protein CHS0354_043047 [Potamilus streckersoni]
MSVRVMALVNIIMTCLIAAVCIATENSEGKSFWKLENSLRENGETGSPIRLTNCTNCLDKLQRNIEELSRIDIIRRRILGSVGRSPSAWNQKPQDTNNNVTNDNKVDSLNMLRAQGDPPKPAPREIKPEVQEIISFSELSENNADNILTFKIHSKTNSENTKAVGAHLWILVHRKRHARRGNKGKKIFLQVSEVNINSVTHTNHTEILTYLRTRVKKTRWQKVSLPLSIAHSVVEQKNKTLNLKVTCFGCGRLVQLILHEESNEISDSSGNKRRKHKKTMKRLRNSRTMATNPFLVICTRHKIPH